MIGLLLAGVFGLGVMCDIADEEEREKYLRKLDRAKAGKTIVRTSDTSGKVYTFPIKQQAIEHPQEITFNPDGDLYYNSKTVLAVKGSIQSIEVYDGNEYRTVNASDLLTITGEDSKETYVYLRFKEMD